MNRHRNIIAYSVFGSHSKYHAILLIQFFVREAVKRDMGYFKIFIQIGMYRNRCDSGKNIFF